MIKCENHQRWINTVTERGIDCCEPSTLGGQIKCRASNRPNAYKHGKWTAATRWTGTANIQRFSATETEQACSRCLVVKLISARGYFPRIPNSKKQRCHR